MSEGNVFEKAVPLSPSTLFVPSFPHLPAFSLLPRPIPTVHSCVNMEKRVSWAGVKQRNPLSELNASSPPKVGATMNFALQAKRRVLNESRLSYVAHLQLLTSTLRRADAVAPSLPFAPALAACGRSCCQHIVQFANILMPFREAVTSVRHQYGYGVAAYFGFTAALFWMNLAVFVVYFFFTILPWYIEYTGDTYMERVDAWYVAKNFIGANGILQNDATFCYYSGYSFTEEASDGGGRVPDNGSAGPLYTLGVLLIYLFQAFYFLLKIGGKISKINFASYDATLGVCHSVYSYDMTTFDPASATSLVGSIRNELETLEGAVYRQDRQKSMDVEAERIGFLSSRKCTLYTHRAIGMCLSLLTLGATSTALFYILENTDTLNKEFPYTATLLVSLMMVTSPFLIRKIVLFEKWFSPKVVTVQSALRIYLIKMFNIGFVIFSVYRKSISDRDRCVETETGSLLLQLLIIDLIVSVFGYAFLHIVKRKIWEKRGKGKSEFLLADSLLELVYSQSLIWLGSVVCPILPFVGCVCHLIRFFGKKFVLFIAFERPGHTSLMKSADDVNFFDVLMLFTLLFCFAPIGYFIQRESEVCGPHINSTALESISFVSSDGGAASGFVSFILKPIPLLLLSFILASVVFLQWKHKKRSTRLASLKYELKDHEARTFKTLLQQYVAHTTEQKENESETIGRSGGGDGGHFVASRFCNEDHRGDGGGDIRGGDEDAQEADDSMCLLDVSSVGGSPLARAGGSAGAGGLQSPQLPGTMLASSLPGFDAALSAIVQSYSNSSP